MNLVQVIPVGTIDLTLLQDLCAAIPKRLKVECQLTPFALDPAPAYHPERQQFHSSEILQHLYALLQPRDWRLLAVADIDLYIPILKYVFGEAQVGGPCAVVSAFRLRQEFYGLERDDALLRERLLKECVHELSHTLSLRHCQDYRCVMASSHAVEWIDLRESVLCESCLSQVEGRLRDTKDAVNPKFSLP